jgi:hypothetical protein
MAVNGNVYEITAFTPRFVRISDKQAQAILSLAAGREISDEHRNRLTVTVNARAFTSYRQVDETFAWLRRQPIKVDTVFSAPLVDDNAAEAELAHREVSIEEELHDGEPQVDADAKVTEPGFYAHGDKVYRVVSNKAGTRLYAKPVTGHGFDFEGGRGAMAFLRAGHQLTPKQVRLHGVSTGVCANCSTRLEDPISIDLGLGTHCGPAILGRESYKAHRKASLAKPEVAAAVAARKARRG